MLSVVTSCCFKCVLLSPNSTTTQSTSRCTHTHKQLHNTPYEYQRVQIMRQTALLHCPDSCCWLCCQVNLHQCHKLPLSLAVAPSTLIAVRVGPSTTPDTLRTSLSGCILLIWDGVQCFSASDVTLVMCLLFQPPQPPLIRAAEDCGRESCQ